MKGASKTSFLKTDRNEKNLCIYLLPKAFLRFREYCLCGAAVGHEYVLNAFAESNLKRMLGSYPHVSADIFSNVKLLMCHSKVARHLHELGKQLTWGRRGLKAPLRKSHSIKPVGHRQGPLCWGLFAVWRHTLLCPNSGTGQSDSAQKPERNATFEGLQVYFTFKYKQQPWWQGQEEAELCSLENSRSALVNDLMNTFIVWMQTL